VPGAMIAHPKLHLRNWQPFQPIAAVIEHLRTFIVRFARVDLASVGKPLCTRDMSRSFPRTSLHQFGH